jgi:hypothetical protein
MVMFDQSRLCPSPCFAPLALVVRATVEKARGPRGAKGGQMLKSSEQYQIIVLELKGTRKQKGER